MRPVAIIGIGQTKIEENWDQSLRELGGDAALAALNDARMDWVDAVYIGNMMSGSANKQQQLGALVSDWVGLRYTEAMKIESACGSGASAFRMGLMAIASGEMDCVTLEACTIRELLMCSS